LNSQTKSKDYEAHIQLYRITHTKGLSIIQKTSAEIASDKTTDHKTDQYKYYQCPIHFPQGYASLSFVLQLMDKSVSRCTVTIHSHATI